MNPSISQFFSFFRRVAEPKIACEDSMKGFQPLYDLRKENLKLLDKEIEALSEARDQLQKVSGQN